MDYQLNFSVSAQAVSMVAEISALIERYTITQEAAELQNYGCPTTAQNLSRFLKKK